MTPLVSVIMSVYREPNSYIAASVNSILGQTLSNLEFIILQDDPLNKRVTSLLAEFAEKDRRIQYVKNERNLGLAISLNRGFEIARGKYVARMDGDDVSFPERLQRQLSFLEENVEISLVGTSVCVINEVGKVLAYIKSPVDCESVRCVLLSGAMPCIHPTWFFRKELLNTFGGYRDLPVGQDYDFLARLIASGVGISNLNEPLLGYRDHQGRIRYKKHILQIRFGEYIRKGLEKNVICDNNYFNKQVIDSRLRVPFFLDTLHKMSQRLSRKGRYFKRKNRLVFVCLLAWSGLVSPLQMYCIFNEVRRRLKYRRKDWFGGKSFPGFVIKREKLDCDSRRCY